MNRLYSKTSQQKHMIEKIIKTRAQELQPKIILEINDPQGFFWDLWEMLKPPRLVSMSSHWSNQCLHRAKQSPLQILMPRGEVIGDQMVDHMAILLNRFDREISRNYADILFINAKDQQELEQLQILYTGFLDPKFGVYIIKTPHSLAIRLNNAQYCQGCLENEQCFCRYYKKPVYQVTICSKWHDRTGHEIPGLGWY